MNEEEGLMVVIHHQGLVVTGYVSRLPNFRYLGTLATKAEKSKGHVKVCVTGKRST